MKINILYSKILVIVFCPGILAVLNLNDFIYFGKTNKHKLRSITNSLSGVL